MIIERHVSTPKATEVVPCFEARKPAESLHLSGTVSSAANGRLAHRSSHPATRRRLHRGGRRKVATSTNGTWAFAAVPPGQGVPRGVRELRRTVQRCSADADLPAGTDGRDHQKTSSPAWPAQHLGQRRAKRLQLQPTTTTPRRGSRSKPSSLGAASHRYFTSTAAKPRLNQYDTDIDGTRESGEVAC